MGARRECASSSNCNASMKEDWLRPNERRWRSHRLSLPIGLWNEYYRIRLKHTTSCIIGFIDYLYPSMISWSFDYIIFFLSAYVGPVCLSLCMLTTKYIIKIRSWFIASSGRHARYISNCIQSTPIPTVGIRVYRGGLTYLFLFMNYYHDITLCRDNNCIGILLHNHQFWNTLERTNLIFKVRN